MSSVAQRLRKLKPRSIWHDSKDNKVEVTRVGHGKVWFQILELPDHQPKNQPAGTVRIQPMEDRIECMSVASFVAKGTGFDCMAESPQPKIRIY